jgi:hypothetical protein
MNGQEAHLKAWKRHRFLAAYKPPRPENPLRARHAATVYICNAFGHHIHRRVPIEVEVVATGVALSVLVKTESMEGPAAAVLKARLIQGVSQVPWRMAASRG